VSARVLITGAAGGIGGAAAAALPELRAARGRVVNVASGLAYLTVPFAPAYWGLEGTVPAERLSDAAATLVRAALGRPARDLATTRQGALAFAVVRRLPRRLVDRAGMARLRRLAATGHFEASDLARDLGARLKRAKDSAAR
jgi:hypothetical protein